MVLDFIERSPEQCEHLCLALDRELLSGKGQRVEVGAGTALFRSYDPGVISTDIKAAGHLSGVVDAQNMPFGDCTIRTFYGIHCFHHLPDPAAFLRELERVLVPGGGCVLIEPFHGPIAQWLYPRLFATEHFDKNQEGWRSKLDMTTMHGANQALSYVVFVRDRARLEEDFPQLETALRKPLNNYLRYVTSGGLYFKQLLPDLSIPFLRLVETFLFPLRSFLALHHVIVVRKRDELG